MREQIKAQLKEAAKKLVEKSTIGAFLLGLAAAGVSGVLKEDKEAIKAKYCAQEIPAEAKAEE